MKTRLFFLAAAFVTVITANAQKNDNARQMRERPSAEQMTEQRAKKMSETLLLDEEITVQNDVKQVEQLGIFVKDVMNRLNIGKSLASQLRLAVEEAVVNVMEYAYPAGSTGEINIKVTSDGHRLRFVITDTGIPFNPTEAASADTTLSAEERPVGGLGIFLVRQMMDSINYERIGGKNVLKLRKDY